MTATKTKGNDRPSLDELRARIGERHVVASISGGKDSAAMSLHLTELGIDHDCVFLDTGWEHSATYDYLRGELTRVLGPIAEVQGPRRMVALIRHKGMFPSRLRRFCTQELKVFPMQEHLAMLDCDHINAVGIRRAESQARSRMTEWEWSDGFDCDTWRPILDWTEQDVFDIHRRHGLSPNPLYLVGARRVGCWPCIYARKAEIRLIADISPDRIDLIRELEREVAVVRRARANARGDDLVNEPAWFQDPNPKRVPCRSCGGAGCDICNHRGTRRYGHPWPIDRVVEWSRGGWAGELFAAPYSEQGCMRWGLCDTDEMAHAMDAVLNQKPVETVVGVAQW